MDTKTVFTNEQVLRETPLTNPNLSSSTSMSDEEIKRVLNIPERNKEDYPDIPKEKQVKAGEFLWKLNVLASGADGNLQSLVWDFYDKLDDYVHLGIENSSIELAKSIEYLKDYLQEHDNILFSDLVNKSQS